MAKYNEPVSQAMVRQVFSASPGDSLLKASQIMSSEQISSLVIMDGPNLEGVLTEDDIIAAVLAEGLNPSETTVAGIMTKNPLTVRTKTNLSEAARMIREKDYNILPVTDDGGKLLGVITKTDITRFLGPLGFFYTVGESASKNPLTVNPKTLISEAASLMANGKVSSLLVFEGKRLCGIVSGKDMVSKAVSKGLDARASPVEGIMSADVVTVSPEKSVSEASLIQHERHFRVLPVVDGGTFIGLLTEGDILKIVERGAKEFTEIFDIAKESMEASSKAVSQMVNLPAKITVLDIDYCLIEDVPDLLGSRGALSAGIFIDLKGELAGSVLTLIPEKSAYDMVDCLLTQPAGTTKELDDMGKSAVSELCNVLVGHYMKTLLEAINVDGEYSTPFFAFDMAGSILQQILIMRAEASNRLLVTKTDMELGHKRHEAYFFFMFPPVSLRLMTKRLTG
jgi:chemotaxis protein CheC